MNQSKPTRDLNVRLPRRAPRLHHWLPLLLMAPLGCTRPDTSSTPQGTTGPRELGRSTFGDRWPVVEYEFGNGLRLLVLEDSSTPVVALQIWYGVGSSDEEPGKTGLAHLFEHMMFKRTSSYGPGEFDERLERLGAAGLNAWTWIDQTVYTESLPSAEAASTALKTEAERMTGLIVDQAALASERDVVINERLLDTDNDPNGLLNEQLYHAAFGDHPYGWPTVGWMEDLERFTVDDCVAFYRRHYAPDHARIVVAGDVSAPTVSRWVQDAFGSIEALHRPRDARPDAPSKPVSSHVTTTLISPLARVQAGFLVPAAGHPDHAAIAVTDAILSAGKASTLKRQLVDTGLAIDAHSFITAMQLPSLWEFSVVGREGIPGSALAEALGEVISTWKQTPLDEADLERGRNQILSKLAVSLESAEGRASDLGWAWSSTGDWRTADSWPKAIANVGAQDVERVRIKYLRPELRTVAIGRASNPSPSNRPKISAPPEVAGPPVPARRPAPAVAAAETRHLDYAGASIVMLPDPSTPLVHLRLALPGGTAGEQTPGLAHLTAHMTLRGTALRPRGHFVEQLERLGAQVETRVSTRWTHFDATVPATAWPALLSLLQEGLTRPAFSPNELESLRSEVAASLVADIDEDDWLAELGLRRTLFGPDHPLGRDPRGTPGSIANVDRADVLRYHHRHFSSKGTQVVIGGGFDTLALRDIQGLLDALPAPQGGSRTSTSLAPPGAESTARGPSVFFIHKPGLSQATVALGHRTGALPPEKHATYQTMNDAFAGWNSGALLNHEIRESRGWTYYVGGELNLESPDRWWSAEMAPNQEVAIAACSLALALHREVADGRLADARIERCREARRRSAPFLADTIGKRVDQALQKATTGWDSQAVSAALSTRTLDEVRELATEFYRPQNLHLTIVGDADSLLEQARTLGDVTLSTPEALLGFPEPKS